MAAERRLGDIQVFRRHTIVQVLGKDGKLAEILYFQIIASIGAWICGVSMPERERSGYSRLGFVAVIFYINYIKRKGARQELYAKSE
jgi:hypothetical protein